MPDLFLEPDNELLVPAPEPKMPLAPRRIAAAAEALGFTLHTLERDHVIAYRVDLRAGFEARWKIDGKNTEFAEGRIRDPFGFEVENWADYAHDANALRRQKDEPEKAYQQRVSRLQEEARRRDADYNDGSTRIEKEQQVTSTTPIHLWLNDWMEVLGVDAKRLPIPAPRKKKTETIAAAMLSGAEWS